jgi:hypothetical protein
MLDLTGHMIIWGGLFAHGDGSAGLMKVVFVRPYETLHFRTTTFWAQLLLGVGCNCLGLFFLTVRVLMWPPNSKLPRSAPAVLNGRCRARLDMSRSSLGVVLRGLPARGRSVTFPV